MASTPAGRQASRTYRQQTVALSARTIQRLLAVWRILDPEDFVGSYDRWMEAVLLVLGEAHDTSVAAATRYYRTFRLAEQGTAIRGTLATPGFDDDTVRAKLTWAGPAGIGRNVQKGKPFDLAVRDAGAFTAAYGQQITLDAGRNTIRTAVDTDPQALGWARYTDGSPCAFCALLASRGPVYKSRTTADFQTHPSCGCGPEPVFSNSQDWPPGARQWREIYREAARGQRDPLNAFRRAYEQ